MKNIHFIIRFFLALVFIFSGLMKLVNPADSIRLVEALLNTETIIYYLFITSFAVFEFLIGLSLMIKYQLKTVSVLTFSLCLLFVFISIYGNIINLDVNCGCFGESFSSKFDLFMIFRNGFFLLCSMFLLRGIFPGKKGSNKLFFNN